MTPTTWHADAALLDAFAAGRLDGVVSASLERHLERCASCRTALPSRLEPAAREAVWDQVRRAVESPPAPAAIRLARRLGVPESTSVVLAATASLRTAWIVSAVVALAFATAATVLTGGRELAPFLLVAPLVPVLGVAAAYNERQDPLEALATTAPFGRTRLILLRTLAVLVSVLPVAVPLGLFLPGPAWVAGAWLGPALMLIPMLLALASFVGPRAGAAVIAIGWSGVVLASVRHLPATWPVEGVQQAVYLALALAALAVLAVRSRRSRQIGVVL